MALERLDSYSTKDLARARARRSSRSRAPARGPDPCYELFRRAFAPSPDDDAWQAILSQYRKLVLYWLGQYASDDNVQEIFLRFWETQQNAVLPFTSRFPNTGAVMGYLRRCATAVRIEAWREEKRRQGIGERLCDAMLVESVLTRVRPGHGHSGVHFKQLLLSKLKNEKEKAVFELTYYYDLLPGDIQAMRPDLFPDVRRVYRVKENLLKRLQRDPDLQAYWANHRRESAADGGNTTGLSV